MRKVLFLLMFPVLCFGQKDKDKMYLKSYVKSIDSLNLEIFKLKKVNQENRSKLLQFENRSELLQSENEKDNLNLNRKIKESNDLENKYKNIYKAYKRFKVTKHNEIAYNKLLNYNFYEPPSWQSKYSYNPSKKYENCQKQLIKLKKTLNYKLPSLEGRKLLYSDSKIFIYSDEYFADINIEPYEKESKIYQNLFDSGCLTEFTKVSRTSGGELRWSHYDNKDEAKKQFLTYLTGFNPMFYNFKSTLETTQKTKDTLNNEINTLRSTIEQRKEALKLILVNNQNLIQAIKNNKETIKKIESFIELDKIKSQKVKEINKKFNQSVETVKIGNQVWMKRNLDVTCFKNGDTIHQAKSIYELNTSVPSWCYFQFYEPNGKKYGKLYNYAAVSDIRGIAPDGWHIPDLNDFNELKNFLEFDSKNFAKAGSRLKAISGWKKLEKPIKCKNCEFSDSVYECKVCDGKGYIGTKSIYGGTNNTGFSALPSMGYLMKDIKNYVPESNSYYYVFNCAYYGNEKFISSINQERKGEFGIWWILDYNKRHLFYLSNSNNFGMQGDHDKLLSFPCHEDYVNSLRSHCKNWFSIRLLQD